MYSKYASSITKSTFDLNFDLKLRISLLFKYVPVGLLGLARNTILVFLFTFFKIFSTLAL